MKFVTEIFQHTVTQIVTQLGTYFILYLYHQVEFFLRFQRFDLSAVLTTKRTNKKDFFQASFE